MSFGYDCFKQVASDYAIDGWVSIAENYTNAVSNTRRPVYMVRGRQLTHEQMIEILSNEEPLFSGWNKDDLEADRDCFDSRETRDILKNCFYRKGYGWLSTWLYSDGTIGGNLLEWKYPEADELLPKWIELGLRYPFLDMAVGYTVSDEGPCYGCAHATYEYAERFEKHERNCRKTCRQYEPMLRKYTKDGIDFKLAKTSYECNFFSFFDTKLSHPYLCDLVEITIVISGGKVSVTFEDEAWKAFKEYYDKYNDANLEALYDGRVTEFSGWHIFSKDIIKECFRHQGLPDKCYDIAVQKGFITEIPDNALIITPQFIRNQHKAMLKKYNLK